MGSELHASFHEGSYKKPKLSFQVDPMQEFDPKTGERRGDWKITGFTYEHYIILPEDKNQRRKFLEDLISKCNGMHPRYLT